MRRIVTALLGLAVGVGALAQPEEPRFSPERLRERLEGRLADLEEERARIEGAIAKLDEGAGGMEVMRELRPDRMDGPPEWEGPERGPGDGARDGAPLTEAEKERVRAFIEEQNPQMAARLRELRETRPELAERLLERATPRIRELMRLREENPELFGLRTRSMRLGLELREAAMTAHRLIDAEGEASASALAAMAEVERLVRERAEVEVSVRRAELDALERRLERLRAEVEGAGDGVDALVEREMDRIRQRMREGEPGSRRGGREGGEGGGRGGP